MALLPYSVVVATTSTGEPITRQQAKDHLRVTSTGEDEYIDRLITTAREQVEQEAREALADVKSKLTPAELNEAEKMLERGRENLNIVLFGNGVHNKKYSMLLIDAAITSFEDLIDYLEEGE